ncbi:MAG: fasciclin domain-containing protein [Prevotella sp.]|nr:fasciclin domain-containing protein [Prevotella sp.]
MNSKINRRQLIGFSFIICQLSFSAMLVACSDWDDHYEADSSILSSQQSTLWENISSNGQLSQFASLLKKTGYDQVLSATQTYTVWAPQNGSFDYDALSSMSDARVQREFVMNHIARNNYPASGTVDERVYTLNEKLMFFDGSMPYAIQGVGLSQPNISSRNGTLHMLDGKIPFRANIYESLNNNEYPLDSISEFFHSYDVKKLNEQKSVQGPMLDGEITYLDSVFDEHNDLFTRFAAFIQREDSNYTMIMPTNEAWHKARQQVQKYFHYIPTFEFMENTSTGSDQKKEKVTIKDVKYLQDSIVNGMLLNDLFYNNNLYDNRKLNNLQTGQPLQVDSLYSTTQSKIYSDDARRLLEGAQRVDKSNGIIWLTDSLRMRSWTTWNPEIIIQGENTQTLASSVNVAGTPERIYVAPGTQNPAVPGHISMNSYVEVQPISASTNPGVVFYLPGVRSTTYSLYLVMVPANIVSSLREVKPYKFSVTMGCVDETGTNQDRLRDWVAESNFVSDTARVDTIYLGDFTFPMAYEGTGNYYPYLRVNSTISSRERNDYDRTMRIDCLILRPKELDDFLKEHPDYKYDDGDF